MDNLKDTNIKSGLKNSKNKNKTKITTKTEITFFFRTL